MWLGLKTCSLTFQFKCCSSAYSVRDTLPANRGRKNKYDTVLAPKGFEHELKESRVWAGSITLIKHVLPSGAEPYILGEKNVEC